LNVTSLSTLNVLPLVAVVLRDFLRFGSGVVPFDFCIRKEKKKKKIYHRNRVLDPRGSEFESLVTKGL